MNHYNITLTISFDKSSPSRFLKSEMASFPSFCRPPEAAGATSAFKTSGCYTNVHKHKYQQLRFLRCVIQAIKTEKSILFKWTIYT